MKKERKYPPKLFLRFFRWYCHPKLVERIEGDLLEEYGDRVTKLGKRKADLRFIIDVMSLFRPGIIRSPQSSFSLNHYTMLGNYFKTGFRNILKYRTFSFINVSGLSVAMSVCLLVVLMLADQYKYDRFHEKGERIFRILSERPYSSMPFASTPPVLASKLNEEYSVVEKATGLITGVGGEATYKQKLVEMRGFFADEYFLQLFDFDLQAGNKANALALPNTMVISDQVAKHLFADENPLGKTVEFTDRRLHYLRRGKDSKPVSWGSFTITGVMADKKFKSHLKFDVLMSSSSQKILAEENKFTPGEENWDKAFTYVLVTEGRNHADLTRSLDNLIRDWSADKESLKDYRLTAQPLAEITPGIMVSQPPSYQLPIQTYYFLGLIAFVIMLSACLNYTNLSTARALTRAKEIGIRKVTGAIRKDLVLQFLSESVLTAFLTLLLAVVLLMFIKSAFINLWLNSYLNFEMETDPYVYLIFVAFALLVGIIAGLYPALHLSAFQPIKAIKNPEHISTVRLGMRKILTVGQFAISLFFITTSVLIYTQFRHFMEFEYGFNSSGIVNVALQGNDYQNVVNAFNAVPGVSIISGSEYIPATGGSSGMDINKPGTEDPVNFRILSVDENFLHNLGLRLVAGTNLPIVLDSLSNSIVVNETAVTVLGFDHPADIVGEVLIQTWNNESLVVAGVVKDFWIGLPIGDKMGPLLLRNQSRNFSYANIKVESSHIQETLAKLESQWKSVDAVHPFKYQFFDEELAATHAGILDVVSVAGFLAFIAITIACLGMLGMAMYTAERKRKEVGIRKVLGAESLGIALMLSKDFLKILMIAVCAGAPISYFINNSWLQAFPNRTEFGIGTVLLSTLVLLVLGVLTIASQTIRVSRSNPVESLKVE